MYNIYLSGTSSSVYNLAASDILSEDLKECKGTMKTTEKGIKISFSRQSDYNKFVDILKNKWDIERPKI